jgi:hypothetical protein
VLTREAHELAEAIHGARVASAEVFAGIVVIEFFHKGTDDDARRLAFNLSGAIVDEWPWPRGAPANADSNPRTGS